MAKSLFRKPQARVQGLKICCYGEDGSGKSVYGLTFPKIAVLDSEAKMGVYESNPKHNQNLVALVDTADYYTSLDVLKEVISTKICQALMIDSETYIYEGMQVSSMEVEEERAKNKGGDPADQSVSQRGWGKIKLNIQRLRMLKAQASSLGITLISTAHKEDIMKKVGNDSVKIGEKPSLRKNSGHEYDVVLRFYKEKDLATNKTLYKAEVQKDTTETFSVGTIIESPCYDNTFKDYLEKHKDNGVINTSYDTALEDTMKVMENESTTFQEVSDEFVKLFTDLSKKDASNKSKIQQMLTDKGVKSYKKEEYFDQLKEVVEELKQM